MEYPKTLEQLRKEQDKIKNRFGGGESVITEIPKEYAEKLAGKKKQLNFEEILKRADGITARPAKKINHVMHYDDAKKIVWRICQNKSALQRRQFVVDDSNRSIIQNLVRYFIGDPECEYNLSKGLFLFGKVGLGKTYLMSVMRDFVEAAKIEQRELRFKICADIVDEVDDTSEHAQGINALQKYFRASDDICFDDLGQEPTILKRYGNSFSVMERVLVKRYSNFVNGTCITHVTTNLTPEGIEEVYGSRLADRCNEMFNFVCMTGQSRRM